MNTTYEYKLTYINKLIHDLILDNSDGDDVTVNINNSLEDIIASLGLLKNHLSHLKKTDELHRQKSLEQYEFVNDLVDAVPDGIVGINEKNEIIIFNKQAVALFGYSKFEILGKPIETLMPLYYQKSHHSHTHHFFANPTNRPMGSTGKELCGMKKDGTVFPVDISLNFLSSSSGKIAISSIRDITDKKIIEKKLIDNDTRFRALIEHSLDAFIIVNNNIVVQYASDSVKNVLGYSAEELIGKFGFELIAQEDIPLMQQVKNKILESDGIPLKITLRRQRKDGSIIWCDNVVTNMLNNPAINGIIVNFRDVTERKIHENLLIERESRFRSLIENSIDVITIVDQHLNLIYASDTIFSITGYSSDEMKGKNSFDFIHPDEVEIHYALREQVRNNPGLPHNITYRRRRKNGEYFWCEATITNMLHVNAVQGIVANFRDITHKIEYESAINKSLHLIKDISSSVLGVVLQYKISKDGIHSVPFISDGAKFILGVEPKEIFADTFSIFKNVYEEDRQFILNEMLQSAVSLQPWYFTFRVKQAAEQDIRWIEASANPQKEENGDTVWNCYLMDITQTKMHEKILEEQNSELLKANAELDRFVYSTSHDLRAPLMSVLGIIELANQSLSEPDELAEFLNIIKQSIHKVDEVIKGILSYSRNSRLDIEIEEIEIDNEIKKIVDNVKYLNPSKQVHFYVDVKTNSPFYSDKFRFLSIANNLISNAIKYQRENEKDSHVKITFICKENEGVLVVEDNGDGIPANRIGKIFDMFYRGSVKSNGSGLGLYICKEMVNKLGGKINVSSVDGKRSVFTVNLPNSASHKLRN